MGEKKYIDAEQARELRQISDTYFDTIENNCGTQFAEGFATGWMCGVDKVINKIPTADVEEVKHARWIMDGQMKIKSGYRFTYHCSLCFRLVRRDLDDAPINDIYPYCHCGAKMDGKEKDGV